MDYEMNDYFFGYDQYEDLPDTESFVEFGMSIAEEGFGDTIKKAGKWLLDKLNMIWSKFMKFIRMIKDKIKSIFKKSPNTNNEEEELKNKIKVL